MRAPGRAIAPLAASLAAQAACTNMEVLIRAGCKRLQNVVNMKLHVQLYFFTHTHTPSFGLATHTISTSTNMNTFALISKSAWR